MCGHIVEQISCLAGPRCYILVKHEINIQQCKYKKNNRAIQQLTSDYTCTINTITTIVTTHTQTETVQKLYITVYEYRY